MSHNGIMGHFLRCNQTELISKPRAATRLTKPTQNSTARAATTPPPARLSPASLATRNRSQSRTHRIEESNVGAISPASFLSQPSSCAARTSLGRGFSATQFTKSDTARRPRTHLVIFAGQRTPALCSQTVSQVPYRTRANTQIYIGLTLFPPNEL